MPFIKEILDYGSLSIVGLEKNTGKTECLNYILGRLPLDKIKVGVSSIGIDGEKTDQVTRSSKPEIFLREGIFFTTSEKHYRQRKILSELVSVSDEHTSLGRLVTARAITAGKVMLSGPPATASLRRWINESKKDFGIDLCIIDGALSRLSPASPAVSESMVLATGAALSLTQGDLVNKTLFVVKLLDLGVCKTPLPFELSGKEGGVWLYDSGEKLISPLFESAFTLKDKSETEIADGDILFVAGALTDRLLNRINADKHLFGMEVVVRDFTKIFASPLTFWGFVKKGGRVTVMAKSKLIAICVNPVSPRGYKIDSDSLCNEIAQKSGLPVYDIFKIDNEQWR